jgi:ribosomal protein S18 acetylase RimI-like enzyme
MTTIRVCTPADAEVLSTLGLQTFKETFGDANSEEDMALYIKNNFSVERLNQEFEEQDALFFLAELNAVAVGYAKIRSSKNPVELKDEKALEIERIYAVKNVVGKGIGSQLMQTCLDYAKSNGYDTVWLGVWENNTHAIKFYQRWGFEKFSQHIFMLGNDPQTDHLMKKQLI